MRNVLFLSLALNAVAAVGGLYLLLSPARSTGASETSAPLPEPAAVVAVEAEAPARGKELTEAASRASGGDTAPLIPALDELSRQDQVAVLQEAGWSEEDAKVIVLGSVMRDFAKIMEDTFEATEGKYWQPHRNPSMDWDTQRKMLEAQYRLQEAMEDLLGSPLPNSFHAGDLPLPREKQRAAARIEMDYQLMASKLHADAGGLMLPEDQEALALIEEEKRRDLEAILTPEELFEYELRTSPTAMTLRNQLVALDPTEGEFRTIFRLQRELDLNKPDPGDDPEEAERTATEGRHSMQENLREQLGEERYRQYQRSQDWGYRQLVTLADRIDLARENVDRVYDLKEVYETQKNELTKNSDLPKEAREAATAALKEEVAADLKELLGERGVDLYRDRGGHWIRELQ